RGLGTGQLLCLGRGRDRLVGGAGVAVVSAGRHVDRRGGRLGGRRDERGAGEGGDRRGKRREHLSGVGRHHRPPWVQGWSPRLGRDRLEGCAVGGWAGAQVEVQGQANGGGAGKSYVQPWPFDGGGG